MRVLIMASPATTHLLLMAPLAWALRAAGDEVLVTGQPDIVGAAHASGLSAAVVGEPHRELDRWRRREDTGEAARPAPAARREPPWDHLRREWRTRAERLCPRMLDLARAWRPDLLVADPLEFHAQIVGGILGIPAVQHRWGVDLVAAARARHMGEALHEVCVRLGLPDGLPAPAMILDPCPPGVQVPDVPPGTPIRAVPSNGGGLLPEWARRRATGRRICVSVGNRTLHMGGLPMLQRVIAACGALEDTETVITADARSRERVGAVPPSVRLVDPLPLDLFLRDCDAVVHHGGWGTALTTMAFGLPHVILPRFPYLAEVGERIAAAGAGVSLDEQTGENDPVVIRDAVRAVLTEPGYGATARVLAEEMSRMPTPAEVVGTLRELAGTRRAAA